MPHFVCEVCQQEYSEFLLGYSLNLSNGHRIEGKRWTHADQRWCFRSFDKTFTVAESTIDPEAWKGVLEGPHRSPLLCPNVSTLSGD